MLMQTTIILLVVTPFSFELRLGGVLVGVVVLSLFSVGISALSLALALASKGQDWMFWTVQQTFLFPVLLLAGALLPVDGAPRWLKVASDLNPMTYVVEAVRALFAGSSPSTPWPMISPAPEWWLRWGCWWMSGRCARPTERAPGPRVRVV